METVLKITTDSLNIDILEGIKKMFLGKKVAITIEEELAEEDWQEGEIDKNSPHYIEGDEDATQFILNRPALAAELHRRIDSIENGTAKLVSVKPEELL